MSLYIFELSNELKDCGPEARYLLEAMVLLAQGRSAGEAAMSTKQLAKQLCLAEKLVKGALAELKSAQLVVVHEASSGRRGRPAIRYELTSAVMDVLPEIDSEYGAHADLLARLFSAGAFAMGEVPKLPDKEQRVTKGGRPAPPGAANYLSACNRLLLATLLAHSDQFGVVTNTGRAKLCRLTGLDERSLKHRLLRLKDLKLILAFLPGLSSSIFRKNRVDSAYFLNVEALWHILLGREDVIAYELLAWEHSSQNLTRARILGKDRTDLTDAEAVACFLAGKRSEIFNVLRFRLFNYATDLISSQGGCLSLVRGIEGGQLRESIATDLNRPGSWVCGDEVSDRNWEIVVSHFYRLACEVGVTISTQFLEAEPGVKQYGFWALDERRVLRVKVYQ